MTDPTHPDSDGSADLIGWARRNPLRRGVPSDPERSRKVLAAALGVSAAQLTSLSNDDVRIALERLRGLVDHWEALASAAEIDDLTGALRRGAGLAALKREVDRNRRHSGTTLSVLFVDVDKLKSVNDRDGHQAGDRLLIGVVRAIRERLRSYDLVVRYGGDEFICCLSGVGSERAERLAADIQRAVEASTSSTVSIGVASLEQGDDADSVVARADNDLYQRRNIPAARG
jgi:diguanylate cyclase (GGDEF)-like protein